MKLGLIRHGEKVEDSFASPLTKKGEEQIESLAINMVKNDLHFGFHQILSTENLRSIQTCKILEKHFKIPVKKVRGLSEFSRDFFFNNDISSEDMNREKIIQKLLIDIKEKNQNIIFGFHAGINRYIISNLLEIDKKKTVQLKMELGSLSILSYSSSYKDWSIDSLNKYLF